jgi:hypothetical protein
MQPRPDPPGLGWSGLRTKRKNGEISRALAVRGARAPAPSYPTEPTRRPTKNEFVKSMPSLVAGGSAIDDQSQGKRDFFLRVAWVLDSARVKACPVASLEMKAARKYMNGEFRFKYLVYARNGLPVSHFIVGQGRPPKRRAQRFSLKPSSAKSICSLRMRYAS